MIDRIARLDVSGADRVLYDVLLGTAHIAGSISIALAERTRASFATADPQKAATRLERRGIVVSHGGIIVNGLEFGLVETASAPEHNSEVELDHMVIRTVDAERAIASYGGRLGIELRLERHAPQWGMHMLFFRCGDDILEIVQPLGEEAHTGDDQLWGVTWRVRDIDATVRRLHDAQIAVGEIRAGRKPGTRVCAVTDRRAGIRTLLIQQESLPFSNS